MQAASMAALSLRAAENYRGVSSLAWPFETGKSSLVLKHIREHGKCLPESRTAFSSRPATRATGRTAALIQ